MANKGIPVTDELVTYLLDHSIPRTEVHENLVAVTQDALGDTAIMQISPEQGPLLTFLTRMVGARHAIEVGTFTGLSSLCIAEGLPEDGRLVCFDVSERWTSVGRMFWDEAGVGERVELILGDAAETLAAYLGRVDDPVDFAFIDADKPGYVTYFELLVDRLAPGGLIVFDNALFSGEVLADEPSENAAAIAAVNRIVADDDRVDTVLLNVGDGLLIARRR